jgi:hypothetical protein
MKNKEATTEVAALLLRFLFSSLRLSTQDSSDHGFMKAASPDSPKMFLTRSGNRKESFCAEARNFQSKLAAIEEFHPPSHL